MIQYSKYVLSNGLTIIAEQDLSTSLAAINVLYRVGSRNEDPMRTGFAHLFEHLMFGGSKNAADFDVPLQNAGGENNAFTNNDYTNYYDLVPVENIETALWLEADRMCNLNINEKTLETQRKVVIEEFHEVCLNRPYGDNWHHMSALAYHHHPYHWPTIGLRPDHISEADIDQVRSFYDTYYHPGNAILTVSGPLEVDKVFELAEKWFGAIPGKSRPIPEFQQELLQTEMRYKKIDSNVPLPHLMLGFHMPGRTHEDYYACDLVSDLLANGKSSRFYQNLVRQKQVMSTIDCYLSGTADPGLIIIEGRPSEKISVQEALRYIWIEIDKLKNEVLTERELQKVKNKVISSLAMSDLSILNKAISLAYFEWLDALEMMNNQEELYNQVTIEDIYRVCSKYLIPSNASIIEYAPKEISSLSLN